MIDYMADLKAYHGEHLAPRFGEPVGCAPHEIANLELNLGQSLPAAYREFLGWMGRDQYGVFRAAHCQIGDLRKNNDLLLQLLQVNKVRWDPTGNRLVFFSYQEYMAAWFDLPKSDDNPLVTFYAEGMAGNRPKQTKKLGLFLYDQMVSMSRLGS